MDIPSRRITYDGLLHGWSRRDDILRRSWIHNLCNSKRSNVAMAPIKIVLKEPVSDLMYFERNIKEISHAGETLPCSGINLQFNFAGMEYMTLTIPMNFVEIEVARNEY